MSELNKARYFFTSRTTFSIILLAFSFSWLVLALHQRRRLMGAPVAAAKTPLLPPVLPQRLPAGAFRETLKLPTPPGLPSPPILPQEMLGNKVSPFTVRSNLRESHLELPMARDSILTLFWVSKP